MRKCILCAYIVNLVNYWKFKTQHRYNCGFSLIRVHRFQSGRVSASTDNILLSQLKWPIETMYIGLRPSQNIAAANPNQYRDWHNLTLLTDQQLDCASGAQGEVMTDDTVAFNAASIKHKTFSSKVNNCAVVFPNSTETIDTLQLQAHGIQIFATTKAAFYRDYLPYTFGGSNLNTPEDLGALLLNFCLYPGTYQPSIWGLKVCSGITFPSEKYFPLKKVITTENTC